MVNVDAFVREVATDLMLSYILFFGTLCGLVVFAYLLLIIVLRIYRQINDHRSRVKSLARTDVMSDPTQDDNPLPPPPPPKDVIPTATAFLSTMRQRADDPNVVGFNQEVQAICKNRKDDPACEVDLGLGGGTAAAFDAAQDSYPGRPNKDDAEGEDVAPIRMAPPQSKRSCQN